MFSFLISFLYLKSLGSLKKKDSIDSFSSTMAVSPQLDPPPSELESCRSSAMSSVARCCSARWARPRGPCVVRFSKQ